MKIKSSRGINQMELLTAMCWSNAYPLIVFVSENKGKISIDELEFKMMLDKIDILERLDFLQEKGVPLEFDKNKNIIKWVKRT